MAITNKRIRAKLTVEAASLFDLTVRELHSNFRYAHIMPAKFAMWLALRNRGWSYSQIGRCFERDHSTVRSGVARAKWLAEHDAGYADKIQLMTDMRLNPEPIDAEVLAAMLAEEGHTE